MSKVNKRLISLLAMAKMVGNSYKAKKSERCQYTYFFIDGLLFCPPFSPVFMDDEVYLAIYDEPCPETYLNITMGDHELEKGLKKIYVPVEYLNGTVEKVLSLEKESDPAQLI